MRFLIDECLHTSLTDVANKAGHEAHHVTRRGWSGFKDRQLREVIVREEFVFVTNNARFSQADGRARIALRSDRDHCERHADHAARVVERALSDVTRLPDMINKVMEVDVDAIRVYELPKMK